MSVDFAGAAVGTTFGELCLLVKRVVNTVATFRSHLEKIDSTLSEMEPIIKDIYHLYEQLDRLEEMDPIKKLLDEGKGLVDKCRKIHWLNWYKKHTHSNKLIKYNTAIREKLHNYILLLAARNNAEILMTMGEIRSSCFGQAHAENNGKKGSCYRCLKGNRFTEKEVCIVCNAKYCQKCVLRAIGSMPEGRKCVTCIGFRIDEINRSNLGKCSRMLKWLLPESEIKQIMSAEVLCPANEIPPNLVYVNDEPLDHEELLLLRGCPNPPKKLRPGYYWYDKVAGFWGKEGQKPCQIIGAQLNVGVFIKRNASNGNTDVLINGREITKQEVWMLKMDPIRKRGRSMLKTAYGRSWINITIKALSQWRDMFDSSFIFSANIITNSTALSRQLRLSFISGCGDFKRRVVPFDMDILCAEGMISSNGIASMEFSFPTSAKADEYIDSIDQHYSMMRYQLIRVHPRSLGENCKWLEMFEDVNIVLFCISLTEYDEFYEDNKGLLINKMMASKELYESVLTHPTFYKKDFLLIMSKFDLLKEKIEQSPLTHCEWFGDYHPLIDHKSNIGTYVNLAPALARRAFHYMAVKFKRLFHSLTERKLYVSLVTGLEQDSVDESLKYAREIMNWDEEDITFIDRESSLSLEASTS
ncbi:extra-large guanine nucleotide-binding protein 2-like [Eucalyptus grandis]|uniref:extra-large guanine nucleotide-binding protein 2-like n=1 Tax=Eucalyptus grandis TaxID=71139 RepID=UPI00192E9A01|nr:extra-large guanine nucleotide-binding protein 2-like [Eucalyptus grandis]